MHTSQNSGSGIPQDRSSFPAASGLSIPYALSVSSRLSIALKLRKPVVELEQPVLKDTEHLHHIEPKIIQFLHVISFPEEGRAKTLPPGLNCFRSTANSLRARHTTEKVKADPDSKTDAHDRKACG